MAAGALRGSLLLLLLLLFAQCLGDQIDDLLAHPRVVAAALARVDLSSLSHVVATLDAGQPISVLTLGSSVTAHSHGQWVPSAAAATAWGALGADSPSFAYRALCTRPEANRGHGDGCMLPGSVYNLMAYVNASWPHEHSIALNMGVPAVRTRAWVESNCWDSQLPRHVDLLLMQTAQDGVEAAKDVEELYRVVVEKLAQAPPPPLVLLNYLFLPQLKERCAPGSYSGDALRALFRGERPGMDDAQAPLLSWYGASSLSLRDAVWAALQLSAGGGEEAECALLARLQSDHIHPTAEGGAFMGRALVALLSQAVAFARGAPAAGAATARPLPPPLLLKPGWRPQTLRCVAAAQLELLAEAGDGGWAFNATEAATDARTGQVKLQNKPGITALAPGSALTVRLSTRLAQLDAARPVLLRVVHLTSYERMGRAALRCARGCACADRVLDGATNSSAPRVSVNAVASVQLTQSPDCVLRFTVLPESSSPDGGHKFKLIELSVAQLD